MNRVVAYFHTTGTASSILKVDGLYREAHRLQWTIRRFDVRTAKQVNETLAFWDPDGIVVDASADNLVLPVDILSRYPTVYLDCDPMLAESGKVSAVVQDTISISRAAAAELIKHNPMTIAYVGWPERQFWSIRREEAFSACLKKKGYAVRVFRHDNSKKHCAVIKELVSWLPTLPRPIGIFTATDAMSESVLAAAREIGLSVPDDLLVIGVDNDEFICENARPTLSSIDPGFEQAGRQAIAILARLMRARVRKPIVEKFKEATAITRSSTRRNNRNDKTVIAALDYIRDHAAEGISAAEVLKLFACSRSLAERRFRSVTGHSILDEIHSVQIEAAKKLVAKPFQKLDAIPHLCGHSSTAFFQRLFKRETGLTMSEWRKQN